MVRRVQCLLAGLWAGVLLCIATVAAPAAFAALPQAQAGAVVRRIFAVEAAASVVLAVVLIVLERRDAVRRGPGTSAMSAGILLPAGAIFLTVAGYYALQPMMEQARAGQGAWSFGALHAASTVAYGLKLAVVAWFFWLATRRV